MTSEQVDPQMLSSDVRFYHFLSKLGRYAERPMTRLPRSFWNRLSQLKARAVADADETAATACWCVETIARAQDYFALGFADGNQSRFYEFWQKLERCEIELRCLARHFPADSKDYGLSHMMTHVPRFQELFPYRMFISPGMLIKRRECSICGSQLVLRGGCEHKGGEIYQGEMCCAIVKDLELLEVSLVEDPVQKYSVVFPAGVDYNYHLVDYVVRGLRTPWHSWNFEMQQVSTEMYPGTRFFEQCPCNRGKTYGACCRAKPRQHCEVSFGCTVPKNLPGYIPPNSAKRRHHYGSSLT